MSDEKDLTTRRQFLMETGKLATISALGAAAASSEAARQGKGKAKAKASPDAAPAPSPVKLANPNAKPIQIVLVGCGGRGSGAVGDALLSENGPVKLVAMADVFPDKFENAIKNIAKRVPDFTAPPADRRFIGFDAYRKAMDCLNPGDVVILATPPAFRWVHFTYAIEKNLNVFMEKPVSVDGPTTRRMIKLGEEAKKKNLKVGVGLMVRHCRGRQELLKRINDGEIGDIIAMRGYRMSSKSSKAYCGPKPENMTELLYQINNFHSFLWASGGCYSDYYIHQIDELSWMKGAWPVEAMALGGRHYRGDALDQNFDVYSIQYVYPDGTRLFYDGRNMDGCHDEFASYVHGSKNSAIVTTRSHTPGMVRIIKGQNMPAAGKEKVDMNAPNVLWGYPQPEKSPYLWEWDDLLEAIRTDKPYNEVERGAIASMVACMGRMAAHTGQIVTYDQMLNCEHEFAPGVADLTMDGPAPLRLVDGKYPVPEPGKKKLLEF